MTETKTKAWICTMCGHIHNGEKAPARCPVCASTHELFDPYVELPPVATVPGRWHCTMCGHVHSGDQPPQKCPACGSPPELFEP